MKLKDYKFIEITKTCKVNPLEKGMFFIDGVTHELAVLTLERGSKYLFHKDYERGFEVKADNKEYFVHFSQCQDWIKFL